MARVDDYIAAKKIAAEELSRRPPADIARMAGFELSGESSFKVPFLDRVYRLDFPDFVFKDEAEADRVLPIQEEVLILHYMLPAKIRFPSGNWIAYREIPGASFYFGAFVKRAIEPLTKAFGFNIAGLKKAALLLNGKAVEPGDAAFEFYLFPKVPLRLTLWGGDDEFSPEANILFDETIGEILSPEDAAWLAGMLVYRLMAISKK